MAREKMVLMEGVEDASAEQRAQEVLGVALSQVGFIPNMYRNMANLPALLDTYLHGYRLFREEGAFTAAEQEVVFLAISHENECEYCVTAHSMLAAVKSGVPAAALQSLRNGERPAEPKLAALDAFTRVMMRTRGNPQRKDIDTFLGAGFTEEHILSIVLAISVKVLSNYSNHLFNTDIDEMFASYQWPEDRSGT